MHLPPAVSPTTASITATATATPTTPKGENSATCVMLTTVYWAVIRHVAGLITVVAYHSRRAAADVTRLHGLCCIHRLARLLMLQRLMCCCMCCRRVLGV